MVDPVRYRVTFPHHIQHLVDVAMSVPADLADAARVVLPAWTPGSYLIRNYSHHLQRIAAVGPSGEAVALDPDGHSAWRLPARVGGRVEIGLEFYANELTVRTNHVDDHHALLVPPATFPYVEGGRDRPHEVVVAPPPGWSVWSLLPRRDAAEPTFAAGDYDHLADSAFAAGRHPDVTVEVSGVTHRFVWAGHAGRPDLERIGRDVELLAGAAVEVFGGELPTESYTFVCLAWDRGGGGLEHRDGAVLAYPAHAFTDADGYRRFQSLVAHEYFHLWNGKRLMPAALTDLDYERPVHTTSLWVTEGWTAYYDHLLCVRSGLWSARQYLDSVGEAIASVLERPGRTVQSVRQASHEAWVKHYVRDENTPNATVDYYTHGSVLAFCLDLLLRGERPGSDGLDDVLRLLWGRPEVRRSGYTEDDVEHAAAEVAGRDLADFFAAHVGGHADPPIDDLVRVVGLRFAPAEDAREAPPDLGVEVSEDDAGITFSAALRGRPAWQAGVTGGDRLLALDGARVGRGELRKALGGYRGGDTVEVTVLRGPRLLHLSVTLGPPRPRRRLESVERPSDAQRRAFRRWCGAELVGG